MFIRWGLLLPGVILTFRGSPFIPPCRSPPLHSHRLYTLTDVAPSPQPATHSLQALVLSRRVLHGKSRHHHRRPAPRSFRCVGCRFGHRSAYKIPVRAPRPFPVRCLLRRRRLETSTFTLKGTHRPKTGRRRLSGEKKRAAAHYESRQVARVPAKKCNSQARNALRHVLPLDARRVVYDGNNELNETRHGDDLPLNILTSSPIQCNL